MLTGHKTLLFLAIPSTAGAVSTLVMPSADQNSPCVETVPLQDRFKSVWEAHSCDAEPGLGGTGRTVTNGAIYDAHIRAVKLMARISKLSEWQMFHEMRWGRGNVALAPTPPELEGAESQPDASEAGP